MTPTNSGDARARSVRAAYDELGPRFGDWTAKLAGEPLDRFLGELVARLDEGARILELGCGDGRTTKRLAERFEIVGVDLSEEQLRLARACAPGATFLHADMMELALPDDAYDAVTAFYSLMHVPREDHPELLARIRSWLRPSGLFLAPMSTIGGTDRTERWLGVEMFFSGWDAEANGRLVREAGFEVLVDEVIPMWEPDSEYETAFLWVLARKPG
jgi:cyclopropane fatty-acyl-phospholipid synthase-like methyltransferase